MDKISYTDIQNEHEALLKQFEKDEASVDVAMIHDFLNRISLAGEHVAAPEQRAQLRTLIRFWNSYALTLTDNASYKVVELRPPVVEVMQKQREVETIGEYELQEVIGKGGFSTVYSARHKQTKNIVALKVFDP